MKKNLFIYTYFFFSVPGLKVVQDMWLLQLLSFIVGSLMLYNALLKIPNYLFVSQLYSTNADYNEIEHSKLPNSKNPYNWSETSEMIRHP